MRRLLIMFTVCLTLASCAPLVLSGRVKKLEPGMTKAQVTNIMGKQYRVMYVSAEPEGTVEVLQYHSGMDEKYFLHFIDGVLVRYNDGME